MSTKHKPVFQIMGLGAWVKWLTTCIHTHTHTHTHTHIKYIHVSVSAGIFPWDWDIYEEQKFAVSQFWRNEVQDQTSGKFCV
jgi:hypothetical protein